MERCRTHPAQAGSSLVEFAVCIALFGVFVAVFLERGLYYQEQAEKTAMEMTVENMRTSLRYRIADLMLASRMSEIPTLADENPMGWLAEKPANYLGELDMPPGDQAKGNWYYDKKRRELVYLVNNRRHFVPSTYRDFTVRYRLMPILPEKGAVERQVWIGLVSVSDYSWLP
jgi:general secretion pathway protein G